MNGSGIPEEGEDLAEHISKKYGPQMAARFSQPDNPLSAAGAKVGIAFNPQRKVIPTMRGHSLMEWANKRSVQDGHRLMEALFKAYFEGAQNVNQRDVLLGVGRGVFGEEFVPEMEAAMDSRANQDEVVRKDRDAKTRMRVSGVPYFVIGEQAFSGAQPPEFLAEVLEDQKA